MKNFAQKLLVILIGLPILIYAVLESKNLIYYFSNQRAPVRYVLPDGYQGWVVIQTRPDCAASAVTDSRQTFVIPNDGWLCTQDRPARQGFAQDQIVYANALQQNLVQHPGSRMNRVWYDRAWQQGDSWFLAFYVGAEVFKKDQPRVFLELQDQLRAKGQGL